MKKPTLTHTTKRLLAAYYQNETGTRNEEPRDTTDYLDLKRSMNQLNRQEREQTVNLVAMRAAIEKYLEEQKRELEEYLLFLSVNQ